MNEEFRNYYIKLNKKNKRIGLLFAFITILLGVWALGNPISFYERARYVQVILGETMVASGIFGIIGALRGVKEVPEGEYYCYPDAGFFILVMTGNEYFFFVLMNLVKTADDAILFSVIVGACAVKAMFCIFKSCTHFLVKTKEEIVIVSFGSVKRIKVKSIKVCKPSFMYRGYKAFDDNDKVIFEWGKDWDGEARLHDDLEREGVRCEMRRK